jgi:MoCo/4Fe-4S cofactor protein with predicted Tat translocation signal
VSSLSKHEEKNGRVYWQSIDQLLDTPEYRKQVLEQYNLYKDKPLDEPDGISRRKFLTLMAASLAMASLAGCRRPVEKIVPYVIQPEEVIPGVPSYYATTMPFRNSAYGLVVECHEGRPTKIEGNPLHPSALGSSNSLIQAATLNLYDPDRSNKVMHQGAEDTYANFLSFWRDKLKVFDLNSGKGLAVLAEPFSSPTLARLQNEFKRRFPDALWLPYEPISDENTYKAIENQTGKKLRPIYQFQRANVILSLDSDFLYNESENISAARGFADGRRLKSKDDSMNRLYAVENMYTVSGGMADHRLRVKSSAIGHFAIALTKALEKQGLPLAEAPQDSPVKFDEKWIEVLTKDLIQNKSESLIVAGRGQPVWVHELVFKLNEALGNIGNTLLFKNAPDSSFTNSDDLKKLNQRISNNEIDTLVIIGGNPAYDVPVDHDFESSLAKIPHTIHLSTHIDETSSQVEWHIPRTHFLESWGDARAVDGSLSIIQPMIAPLFDGRMDVEFYELLATGQDLRGYDIVRSTWKNIIGDFDFEKKWRKVLHDGILKDSALPDEKISLETNISNSKNIVQESSVDNLELVFYPSQLYDGRFANNGWLQELPDAITRLSWDNAVLISPKTAKEHDIKNSEMVKIEYESYSLTMPVWIVPGQADYSLAVALGYGRKKAGRVGNDVGFNTYALRTSGNLYIGSGAKISKTGNTYPLANVQDHNNMAGRPIVREAALDEYRAEPEFAREMVEHPPLKSMYPEYDYSKGYQWGMVIDLNTCIGCNACVIACQSENNVQIVGKEQVEKGREMHWIRNDRYFAGDIDNPQMVHMPVPCQQCENAPCESVCPVAATSHDKEGLNVMVYNRCIGTRYCSNNCPYKVRRFNFFNYINKMPEVVKMAQNPDVTVRSRGVMEKCTFCIQRITRAKHQAKLEGRTVADGEIVTACQQACPTQAIHFGNINDPRSVVTQLKQKDRNYNLLAELNVRPRNSYLAKIRNPNPELEIHKSDKDTHS